VGFIKVETFRLFQTNSTETAFKTAIAQFKPNLVERGYPETLVSTTLAEITFEERKPAQRRPKLGAVTYQGNVTYDITRDSRLSAYMEVLYRRFHPSVDM